MVQLIRNKYLIGFIITWAVSVSILHVGFQQPVSDSVSIAFIFGIFFPLLAWILVRRFHPELPDKPAFNKEIFIIGSLILLIVWYISYGTGWINNLAPKNILSTAWKNSIFILLKKLLIFFGIPFFVYWMFGFRMRDFGFSLRRMGPRPGRLVLVFIILSVAIFLFQFYFGHGAEPLRKGQYTQSQLMIGLPLCFIWYFFEVGLVEEFFFRALLQSRITVLLKSNTAGILISGLIFGLAHAPGLYLRGASSEGINEQLPFIFWAAYTVSVMSLAGIFLGIIWSRTKNIYLIMAIHAIVDLLPNIGDFTQTWNIK